MTLLRTSFNIGSDWSAYELMEYDITVTVQSPQKFFGEDVEPNLGILGLGDFAGSAIDEDDVPRDVFKYLTYLNLAAKASQESLLSALSEETLRLLGFIGRGRALITCHSIPFTAHGDYAYTARTGVSCLLNRQSMILLILHNKTVSDTAQPEPQVILEAIAAYQYNNEKRETRGLPTLDVMTIPCITMVGTRPTFYLVPVTRELNARVVSHRCAGDATKVVKCVTTLGPSRLSSEGMETPAYRRVAFQRFLMFKGLARQHWKAFID